MDSYIIILLVRIFVDVAFLVILFFVLIFGSLTFLNRNGIYNSDAGLYSWSIMLGGMIIIDYLLVKNNIPIGFTNLLKLLGFLDIDCQRIHIFSKCI